MSYVVSRHGSNLLVAANAVDERAITHALNDLKPGLFLDVDHNEEHSCLEYKVRLRYSRGQAPVYICGWCDENGRPLPLSSALIEKVKRLIEVDTSAAVAAHNKSVKEEAAKATGDEVEDVARDMLPFIQGKRAAVLHRGPHLRRSRRRKEDQAAEQARAALEAKRRNR